MHSAFDNCFIFVSLYATPKAVWTSMENLSSGIDKRLNLFSEKNFASFRVFHPYGRLFKVRRNIV
jgi:hypothetical protein